MAVQEPFNLKIVSSILTRSSSHHRPTGRVKRLKISKVLGSNPTGDTTKGL